MTFLLCGAKQTCHAWKALDPELRMSFGSDALPAAAGRSSAREFRRLRLSVVGLGSNRSMCSVRPTLAALVAGVQNTTA